MNEVFIGIQELNYENSTLEAREVTKLHYRDLTSSNDEVSNYAQSIKFIFTRSMPHLVHNETLDLYTEGATLAKCIHEGRPKTTKPTFVALPSLTSHSTFYECSRSILCKPQASPHRPLTSLGVIISYSLRLERKITLPSIQESFRHTCTLSQLMKQYDAYTASPAKKTTTAIIKGRIDQSFQFEVKRFTIARDTSIKEWPKIHPKF